MTEKTHYDVEDVPPVDVETSLAMYEQSKTVVAGGVDHANHLLSEAGPLLESLFNMASAQQDEDLMAAVNSAWDKTQQLATIVSQQSAAINGADVVIGVVQQSRKAVLAELNTILKGLKDMDSDSHPLVEQFRNMVEIEAQEMMYEDMMWSGDDYDFDTEALSDSIHGSLESLLDGIGKDYHSRIFRKFTDILMGYEPWTAEQGELMQKLLASFIPTGLAPIETADDYEADEDE